MVLAFAEISEVYPTFGRDRLIVFDKTPNCSVGNDNDNDNDTDQLLPRYEELEKGTYQDSTQKIGCFSWIFLKFGNIFKKIKSMYSRDEKN
jgi:hypothetical protein